ncbi:MAG: hypothetical protein ACFFA0_08540 [Promethearchaeota archaeon]
MPKIKDIKLKCGFCDKEIENKKELEYTKWGFVRIFSCPYCRAILGFIYMD